MGDHAHAKFSVKLLVGPALQAAARGAVQGHDWKPARVTPHRKRQGAPALRLKSPQRLAHRSEHTPARGNASGESTLVDVPVRPHRRGSLRRAGVFTWLPKLRLPDHALRRGKQVTRGDRMNGW